MQEIKAPRWRVARWERRLLTALATAFCAELFFSIWVDNFRVSASVVLYPVLLVTLMQDSQGAGTGALTALMVLLVRVVVGTLQGGSPLEAAAQEYSGALFYLCYELLLSLQVRDRRRAPLHVLGRSFFLCDLCSNILDLSLSKGGAPEPESLGWLCALALGRAVLAVLGLWAMRRYRRLLLEEEHERRYQRLFLMTANLKNELYFLKKDTEHIEGVMTRAYQLYEELVGGSASPELPQLALSIARDVHEVKKDNLSIIRGIEREVAGAYDQESIRMSDLLHILEDSTYDFLREQKLDIQLECWCGEDFNTGEHYRLMSILKNLVTNAAEAIQGQDDRGSQGLILVDVRRQGDLLALTVRDNGPGLSERAMQNLFRVGYSTKFDPETGNINRGVGLAAVQFMVEELGGSIQVDSDKGAQFRVYVPIARVQKGEKP